MPSCDYITTRNTLARFCEPGAWNCEWPDPRNDLICSNSKGPVTIATFRVASSEMALWKTGNMRAYGTGAHHDDEHRSASCMVKLGFYEISNIPFVVAHRDLHTCRIFYLFVYGEKSIMTDHIDIKEPRDGRTRKVNLTLLIAFSRHRSTAGMPQVADRWCQLASMYVKPFIR